MSETSKQLAAEADEIHPVIKKTNDFSDRLSPMLIKELRQGLKGYGFMVLFIAIQAILALYIFGTAFERTYNSVGRETSIAIFFLLSMATLIVQPLRGISAISGEIKENTIELMIMTRLSAWRIVFGKWISLVSQSALIISSVAPYLILRYFFGGMQLFPEIMLLITIFIISAGITAITVGLSAIPSFILRAIISIAITASVFTFCSEIFDSNRDFQSLLDICGLLSTEGTIGYLTTLACIFYLGWLALDFGASRIAPMAENRATPRKMIALAIIIIAFFGLTLPSVVPVEVPPIILTLIAIPIILISLTESSPVLPTISANFLSKGLFTKLSRFMFYPGWQSGLLYALLIYFITVAPILFIKNNDGVITFTVINAIFSCIIFPLTITKLFFKKKHLVLSYLCVILAVSILTVVIIIITEVTRVKELPLFFSWIPPLQFHLLADASSKGSSSGYYSSSLYTYSFVCTISVSSLAINWLICLISSCSEWKLIRSNEKTAQQILENIPTEQ